MGRLLVVCVALLGLVPLASGCRHVAGACDCDHSNYVRQDTGSNKGCCGQAAAPAAPAPAAPMPK